MPSGDRSRDRATITTIMEEVVALSIGTGGAAKLCGIRWREDGTAQKFKDGKYSTSDTTCRSSALCHHASRLSSSWSSLTRPRSSAIRRPGRRRSLQADCGGGARIRRRRAEHQSRAARHGGVERQLLTAAVGVAEIPVMTRVGGRPVMPDLRGLMLRDASVLPIPWAESDEPGDGFVVSQTPEPGDFLSESGRCTLQCGAP
jgi:hypothetical protein